MAPNMPESIGKYLISEVLGKGAMGVVYKAFDPHIRRTVALKTIRKDLIDEDQAGSLLARFQNEARAAGRLTHPGVVSVYEYAEAGDLAFLAMEYVQGNSLREYFSRGTRFELGDAVSVMVQLLDALAYAHEQGVWHRDIKPANIIIMTNGRLKVADFGIARIDSSNLTQTGAIMGTPGYMAPEQYQGVRVDWRADIFAAGVVLYQLLTGTRPFTGSAEAIAYKVCYEMPVPPSKLDAERCPPAFDSVIACALAKKPEERYQNAQRLRDEVLRAHAQPVSPTVSEETIITEIIRASGHLESSSPSQQPRADSGASAPRTTPPPGWEAAVLEQVRHQLLPFVGPVAKAMVRRAAASTTDLDALYRLLAEHLADAEERKAFVAGRKTLKGVAPDSAATTVPVRTAKILSEGPAVPLTPELVEAAAKRLANFLGPIAKVVARKAASHATNPRHFHLLLAENLSNEGERERFLREVGVA